MPYSYRGNRNNSSNRRRNYSNKSNRIKKEYIDPNRFIKVAKIKEEEKYIATNKFSDFNVVELIKNNLVSKGYQTPSPIQDQAIPVALTGRDVIGIASTGTGKTAAFAVPTLNRLILDKNSNALIIAPTRELAQQIEDECRTIAKGSGLFGALLIGGTNMGPQLRDLRNKPRVVIGTPGRIKDHLNRGSLNLSTFNIVVLDEVDRMLDMGFVNDVTEILDATNKNRQSFFFSATLDGKVSKLINTFSENPHTISLKASTTSDNVHQNVVRYRDLSDKTEKLHDLLLQADVTKAIVFDETQRDVERLSNNLLQRGFSAEAIHGGKSQGQRQRALNKFKKNEVTILVATDVAARGIDVSDITHVINYSVPKAYDDYIHRIGRAGRAGQIGHALTFISHN